MNEWIARVFVAGVCLSGAACTKSSTPAQPSGPTQGADASATSSVTVPRPLSPAVNAQVRNQDQPVTLVVGNAVITQGSAATYAFEVGSDAAFAAKVFTKTGVAEGAIGQTSLTIDRLGPGADYFWRARAEGGGTIGPFSAGRRFTIGPAIVVNAPALAGPASGAATTGRPTLTVANATRTGPAGPITYRFELANTNTFAPVVATAIVPETAGQTTYQPFQALAASRTYFWRVTAVDQTNNISGPTSAIGSFVTSLTVDLNQVVYVRGPNVASWAQSAIVQSVEQDGNAGTGGAMCIAWTTPFSIWPSVPFLGDNTIPVNANQWYLANINGVWYAGAGEWLRSDRGFCKSGQGTQTIGPDGGWAPPMSTWVPKRGELVGYMITTPARTWPSMKTLDERSDVVLVPWKDSSPAALGRR
jgi:hypothetical protein